jgi:hypothetical protein
MNTIQKPKPQYRSTTLSPVPAQSHLRFDLKEAHRQLPEEKRAECLTLLRKLIEAVADLPNRAEGAANE